MSLLPRSPFPRLALAAAIAAYILIVVGALVRASGSGLGCPDWPLCHGQPVPPAQLAAQIEYSHRLMASLTAALALAASVFAFRERQDATTRTIAAAVPLVLLAQVLLGAATVLLEL